MFQFDFRNIIVLISLAVHVLLLWFLYRYGRKTPGGKAYAWAILAIAGWVLPIVFYRANIGGEVVLWSRILYLMASFTSTTFFYFTLVFPENKKPAWWIRIALIIECLIVALLCLHPSLIIQDVRIISGQENFILFGPLYLIYTSHISLLFIAGFIVLFLKLKKYSGNERKQLLNILIGYFFASNLAMATNLILPWLGYFELNWMGQFFSTIVAISTTYAILKNRLLDIRIVVTEGLVLLINFFIFIQWLFSDTGIRFLANSIILIAVLCISVLLVKSVKKEIERREQLQKLTGSLEQSNLRLQELDRQKTEFLSIASHQLRTPLSIISGFLELLEDGAYGKMKADAMKVLHDMDETNNRLVKLVDEFLNITRIEQGRVKFSFATHNINDTVDSAVKELTPRAEQKNLEIDWHSHAPLTFQFDDEKIRHVVFNFIDNAIKYSDQGSVVVRTEKDEEGVSFKVTDEGIGFGKEDQASFFQKFYRGKNVEGINVTGTGIGLYICSKFINAHGGRVWAKSKGLGKGSEFGFWIPLNPPPQPEEIMTGPVTVAQVV